MNYIKIMNAYFGFYNYMHKKAIRRSDRYNCMKRLSATATQLTKEQEKQ